jgi:hypothetical protein
VNVPAVHLQRGASLEIGAVHLTRAPTIKQTPAERARLTPPGHGRLRGRAGCGAAADLRCGAGNVAAARVPVAACLPRRSR